MKGGNGVREANGIKQFAEGEPKVGSVHNKTTQLKTSPGWTPPPESFLTALPSRKAAASKKLFRRKDPPTHWIAAVSAAEEFLPQRTQRTQRNNRRTLASWKATACRRLMKGGNGVREANGITQFAEGEPNVGSVKQAPNPEGVASL
jgi:hypothetical protein